MSISKFIAILSVAILAATGMALAGESASKSATAKATKAFPAVVPLPPSRHLLKEAPIVMGRSATVQHTSKLRHVKARRGTLVEQGSVPQVASEATLSVTSPR